MHVYIKTLVLTYSHHALSDIYVKAMRSAQHGTNKFTEERERVRQICFAARSSVFQCDIWTQQKVIHSS